MSNATVLGWFYSIVVAVILTGQTLDNWPWSMFGGGGRTALAATIGNALLGTAIYFVALPVVKLLLGATTTDAPGEAINQYPAQLGVCWAFWMIFWANAFENRPTNLGATANRATRTVITWSWRYSPSPSTTGGRRRTFSTNRWLRRESTATRWASWTGQFCGRFCMWSVSSPTDSERSTRRPVHSWWRPPRADRTLKHWSAALQLRCVVARQA